MSDMSDHFQIIFRLPSDSLNYSALDLIKLLFIATYAKSIESRTWFCEMLVLFKLCDIPGSGDFVFVLLAMEKFTFRDMYSEHRIKRPIYQGLAIFSNSPSVLSLSYFTAGTWRSNLNPGKWDTWRNYNWSTNKIDLRYYTTLSAVWSSVK